MPFIIGGTGKRLEGFSASKILPMCYGDHDRLVHTKGEKEISVPCSRARICRHVYSFDGEIYKN